VGVMAQPQVTVTVQESAGGCDLVTDCDNDIICVDIVMSVDIPKTLDSYNIWVEYDGTVISREAFGVNNNTPVGDNSCVIANGSQDTDLEGPSFNPDHWRVSGVPGMGFPMVANTPYIVHTICFIILQPAMLNGQQICVGGNVSSLLTTVTFSDASSDTDVPETCMTLGSDFASCTLLPIDLLDFSATRKGSTSVLDWTTTNEINNQGFEVQRSTDLRHFEKIGWVDAKIQLHDIFAYQFIDLNPKHGVNYYRLKQIDFDGRFDYSPIRHVTFEGKHFAVRVTPNPATDFLSVGIQSDALTSKIQLIDVTGNVVKMEKVNGRDSIVRLPLDDLMPGMYTLVVDSGTEKYIEQVVIIDSGLK
jgi:hypothetical protein